MLTNRFRTKRKRNQHSQVQWHGFLQKLKKGSTMHLHPYRPNLPNFHLIKTQLKRRLKALGLSVLPPLIDPNLLNCFKSTWKNFSFSELQAATDNLSHENLIGVGGYSEVSWGCSRMIRATPINKEEDYISELGGFRICRLS